MEYVYAALLLHKAGKKITEESMKKVLEAAGVKVDEARVKAMVVALEDVNIDEAIANAQPVAVAPAQGGSAPAPVEEKKEEPKEEKKVSEEEAAAGLSGLFG